MRGSWAVVAANRFACTCCIIEMDMFTSFLIRQSCAVGWNQDATEAFLSVGHSQEWFVWFTPLQSGWFNGFSIAIFIYCRVWPATCRHYPTIVKGWQNIGGGWGWGSLEKDQTMWYIGTIGGFKYSMGVRAACCFPQPLINGLHVFM